MRVRKILKKQIKATALYDNYLNWKEGKLFRENSCHPAGHFYSPIVAINQIKSRKRDLWNGSGHIAGVNLEVENQLILLKELSKYYKELPFKDNKQEKFRYFFKNGFYSYTDGIVLYSLMRHLRPAKIIEVGSGYSSAIMLDVNDYFLEKSAQITFIEPNPERLHSLISEEDRDKTRIIQREVQSVPVEEFQNLKAGDILFVDSSHIVKTGSDVNYILFEILPALKAGVFIHFHDIFYPFEYPKAWILEGRNWNENYFLKAFLMYNEKFKIRLFSHYLHEFYGDAFSEMPLSYKNPGGNLWVEKL